MQPNKTYYSLAALHRRENIPLIYQTFRRKMLQSIEDGNPFGIIVTGHGNGAHYAVPASKVDEIKKFIGELKIKEVI